MGYSYKKKSIQRFTQPASRLNKSISYGNVTWWILSGWILPRLLPRRLLSNFLILSSCQRWWAGQWWGSSAQSSSSCSSSTEWGRPTREATHSTSQSAPQTFIPISKLLQENSLHNSLIYIYLITEKSILSYFTQRCIYFQRSEQTYIRRSDLKKNIYIIQHSNAKTNFTIGYMHLVKMITYPFRLTKNGDWRKSELLVKNVREWERLWFYI